MRVLVTGGAGFVARHLSRELSVVGHDVVLTDVVPAPGVRVADLTDGRVFDGLVENIRPDACVHLGAMAFVPDGDLQTERLWRVNVGGTENLCSALRTHVSQARLLFVSTSQVYGAPGVDEPRLVDEDSSCSPQSVYARSKLAAEKVVLQSGLDVCIARPSNHTGPGQSPRFVVPAFVARALDVKSGRKEYFEVGNLESVRDFTDVRDVVSAYRLILEKGMSGSIYNIGGNMRLSMGTLLQSIQDLAGVSAPIKVRPAFFRPTDFALRLSCEKLKSLGWMPSYAFVETLRDMLDNRPL